MSKDFAEIHLSVTTDANKAKTQLDGLGQAAKKTAQAAKSLEAAVTLLSSMLAGVSTSAKTATTAASSFDRMLQQTTTQTTKLSTVSKSAGSGISALSAALNRTVAHQREMASAAIKLNSALGTTSSSAKSLGFLLQGTTTQTHALAAATTPAVVAQKALTGAMQQTAAATRRVATAAKSTGGNLGTLSNRAHGVETQMFKAGQQSANLFAQFNDIGVMMASGQSPMLLAVQQGTQINQVLAQMRSQGKSALAAIGASLKLFINPLNIAVIGMIALGAKGVQSLMKLSGTGKSLSQAMSDAATSLSDFRTAAEESSASADDLSKKFGRFDAELRSTLQLLAQYKLADLTTDIRDANRAVVSLTDGFMGMGNQFNTAAELLNFDMDAMWRAPMGASKAAIESFIADLEGMTEGTLNEMYASGMRVQAVLKTVADEAKANGQTLSEEQIALGTAVAETNLRMRESGAVITANMNLVSAYAAAVWEELEATNASIAAFEAKTRLSQIAIQHGKESVQYANELWKQEEASLRIAGARANHDKTRVDRVVAAAKAAHEAAIAEEKSAAAAERLAELTQDVASNIWERVAAYEASQASLAQEAALLQAILAYGEESTTVAALRRAHHEANARALAEEKYQAEDLVEQHVAATMQVYDLKQAVDAAKSSTAGLASAAGDAARNFSAAAAAADRYKNAVSDGGISGLNSLSGVTHKLQIYIPELRPLKEYFSFVDQSLSSLNRDINKFARDNSGKINDAVMGGGSTTPAQFWESFKTLAVDSYGSILESVFGSDGAGTLAIGKSLEGIMNKLVDQVNNQIRSFNAAVMGINPADAITRGNFGSLKIDTNKFRDMEYGSHFRSFDLIDSLLKGGLGGADGNKSYAKIVALIEQTSGKLDDDGEVVSGEGPLTGATALEIQRAWVASGMQGSYLAWRNEMGVGYTGAGSGGGGTSTTTIKETKQLKAMSNLFGNIVGDIQDKIRLFGRTIGGNVKGMGDVLHKFTISLGKDGKAGGNTAKLVVREFEEYSDKLAKKVLRGRKDLKRAGEGWTDTLERLGKDFVAVNATMLLLGEKALRKATLNNAKYASDIVKIFGGADEFSDAAAEFFNVAFSPEEQNQQLTKYIRGILADNGINNMPTTRGEYRDLVERQDLETKRGRNRWAALIELAPLFDQILPAFGEAAESLAGSTMLDGLAGLIDKAKDAENRFARLAVSLANVADSIRGIGNSPEKTFQILEARFNSLFARSLTGDLEAMEEIGDVAKSYSTAFGDRARSSGEEAYFNAVLANQMDELAGVAGAGEQLSAYQVTQLEKLEEQIEDGKIRNGLVQRVVDAVGGLDATMWNSLNALYHAQTGNNLSAVNTPGTVNLPATEDGQLSFLNNVASGGTDGSTSAVSVTNGDAGAAETGNIVADEIVRMRRGVLKKMTRANRLSRKNLKYTRKTYNQQVDWTENGLLTV